MIYLDYVTGKVYTGELPDPVVDMKPIQKGNRVLYEKVIIPSGDPRYQGALERYLFVYRQVRAYDTKPDWAVE